MQYRMGGIKAILEKSMGARLNKAPWSEEPQTT